MDIELEKKFKLLLSNLEKKFGQGLDVQSVLFLIGVQELGKGAQKFNKQEKTELMHIAICVLLEKYGFYSYEGKDSDGWPHYTLIKELPPLEHKEQQLLIKKAILTYFEF